MSTQLSFSSKGKPAVPELRALFCIPLDETVMLRATKYVQDKGEAVFIRLVGTGYGDEPLSLLVREQYLLKSRNGTCSHCRLHKKVWCKAAWLLTLRSICYYFETSPTVLPTSLGWKECNYKIKKLYFFFFFLVKYIQYAALYLYKLYLSLFMCTSFLICLYTYR